MRHYLEATIGNGGISVREVPCARVVYCVHTIDCTGFVSVQQAVDAIRALPDADGRPRIARVTLVGRCAPAFRAEVGDLYDAVSEMFEYLDLVNTTESEEDYEALARENTSLGLFVKRINDELRDVSDDRRRRMLERAREVGLAAYRGYDLDVAGFAGR